MLFLAMISITLGHFLKKSGHKYLQEAGLTTMIGMLAGWILRAAGVTIQLKRLNKHFVNLFMLLLLPPIIFESGYNLQKKPFFRNIGTIIMFSFIGTFLAMFSSSIMFWLTSKITSDIEFSLKESFAFGSFISATDPVSVLAIFKEMDTDVNLYSIVFGESIMNDAIAITMYDTVKELGKDPESSFGSEAGKAVLQFLAIFVGSLLIGMVSALIVAFIMKRQIIIQNRNE
jgi:sodium/hydrogen exchanger 8